MWRIPTPTRDRIGPTFEKGSGRGAKSPSIMTAWDNCRKTVDEILVDGMNAIAGSSPAASDSRSTPP